MNDRLRIVRSLCDAVAVGAALYLIAGKFPREVMFAETVTNGGDMGTHYYAAAYMRDVLLPKGAVSGWCPGNYCGFPLFQFYFFLPFVLIALASHLIPLTVAFKIGTVLGTFLLPVCAYFGMRLGGAPFPAPAFAALATLPFLFMEANSMWGGNIPSTLAGEFAFSLGFALTILFMGVLHRAIERRRGYAWAGLLVAIIGMTHGYTLLWGLFSTWELVTTRDWWRRVGALTAIHGLAILLMAFWLLPLLAYAPYTTSYSHVWIIKNWQEILPPILWIPTGIALATLLIHVGLAVFGVRPFPSFLGLVWWATGIGILFYYTAKAFHVVDIRFFPFMQLGLCLTAGVGLGSLLAMLPAPEIWPVVGALVVPFYVGKQVTFIPSWVKWNYSGFERKGTYPTLKGINDKLRGAVGDPRVVYEHSPDHEALGTIRVFENLPFFTGRSTLEGLYMQGSPSAPFVFYVQSEVSNVMSCPFPDWGCSRPSLERGVPHLRMMNVSQYIVKSKPIKDAAAKHPGLELQHTIGDYQIYRVKENADRYAIPLTTKPVFVRSDTWKETSYMWFKTATPESVLPVFTTTELEPGDEKLFAAVTDGMPAEMPREPLGPPPVLQEQMGNDRITITGTTPGHPILVRISYHPRWQALTGEKVWIGGPTFMLVFPKGDRVELVFGDGPVVTFGRICTFIGWALFLLAVLPTRRLLVAAGDGLVRVPPVPAFARWLRDWSPSRRSAVLAGGLLIAAIVFARAAVSARSLDADGSYNAGLKIYNANKLSEAIPYFQAAQELSPLSNTAIHSTYFEGISWFRQDKWAEAEVVFQRLVDRFPEGPSAPESLYHVGLCKARLGDMPGAILKWQETERRFPGTPWAKYAGERLAEQKR